MVFIPSQKKTEETETRRYIQSLVLENLSYPFERPNILDIKLGRELHDENATEEKKARMIKKAMEGTSWTTGVRLTGFQVRVAIHRSRVCIAQRDVHRCTTSPRTAS